MCPERRARQCPERAPPRARAGAGMILWISLVGLALLFLTTMVERFFSGQVTSGVSRSLAGDLGLLLAQSCLDEAASQVGRQVNDPKSPLFSAFRKPVPAGETGALRLDGSIRLP